MLDRLLPRARRDAVCSWILCVALIASAGCASNAGQGAWPSPRPLASGVDPRPVREPDAVTATKSTPAERAPVTGELTLREAIALTLRHNPGLEAFAWEVRASEARILEAGLWPNPELEAEADEFGGRGPLAGTDDAELSLRLGQTLPLGGDLGRRRAVAGLRAEQSGWEYEAARLEVVTELTRRFVGVLAEQRRLGVAREELALAEAVLATTTRRVQAGDASMVEEIRARVPVALAQVRVVQAERRLDIGRRQLALLWDGSPPRFDAVVGDLEELEAPPEPELLAHWISENPEVAKWAVQIATRRAEADLARAEAFPDLTARLGVKRLRGIEETALVAGISLPLPLFDRNQGRVRASEHEGRAANRRRREAELRVEEQLGEAWSRLANAYDEAVTLREHALPPAREAFEVTRRAFESGDVAFIDVLDAERTLVELRRQRVTALERYHVAHAEIEGLVGRPLHEIVEASVPSNPERGVDRP